MPDEPDETFDPEDVDWTDPDNYFRCRVCGEDGMGHLAVGNHDWMTCEACMTAHYWGYNVTSVGRNQTESERAAAMAELSGYRVRAEDEDAMVQSEEAIGRMLDTLRREGLPPDEPEGGPDS